MADNATSTAAPDAESATNGSRCFAPAYAVNDDFEWTTEGVLISVVGVVGVVGNLISIYTFSRQKVHRIFHNLLLSLALYDLVSDTDKVTH
jgi:hypothetical protein